MSELLTIVPLMTNVSSTVKSTFVTESSHLMEETAFRHWGYLHNLDDSIEQFLVLVLVFARCTI